MDTSRLSPHRCFSGLFGCRVDPLSRVSAKASAVEYVPESSIKSKMLIKSSPEANFTALVVERQVALRLSAE